MIAGSEVPAEEGSARMAGWSYMSQDLSAVCTRKSNPKLTNTADLEAGSVVSWKACWMVQVPISALPPGHCVTLGNVTSLCLSFLI